MLAQAPLARHRFTVADYHTMIASGILSEDDRVELIEGELVTMSPINPRHASQVDQLVALFHERLGKRVTVRPQNPIQLRNDSEPQPDVALLSPRSDRYKTSHPTPADILLIIEVSDSTLDYDRDVKAPLYARAGIREFWLLNLVDGRLEVYRDPGPQDYRERRLLWPGDTVAPLAFPEILLPVKDLLD